MTPTPRLVPDRPSDADVGRAFLSVLRDPATAWRETGAQPFIDRVAEIVGRDWIAAPAALAHPSRGVVDEGMVARAMDADAEEYGAPIPASRVRRILEAAALPADTITVQEAWEWAGGNLGIKATRADLEAALRDLDAVCDEADAALPAVPVDTSYRLLTRADTVQSGDEVLDDDTVSWKPLAGWERGLRYDPALFMPARRMLAAAPAQEGG